jgi:hypothetical protein
LDRPEQHSHISCCFYLILFDLLDFVGSSWTID